MAASAQLFITCILDTFFPEVGESVVSVVERLGGTVELPDDQTCCGLPLYNSGFADEAARVAAHNVEALAGDVPVIVPSGSCAWMMRDVYPTLLDARAANLSHRVLELSEWVSRQAPQLRLAASAKVAYHPSCHQLRALQAGEVPTRVLSAVDGVEVRPLPRATECCGFGGTFAVRNAALSADMQADKLRCAIDSGADTLVVTDAGCLMHLRCGAERTGCPVEVRHLAEVLADGEVEE